MEQGQSLVQYGVALGDAGRRLAPWEDLFMAVRGISADVHIYERVTGPMETRGAGIVVQGDLVQLFRQHHAPDLPMTACRVRRYFDPDGGVAKSCHLFSLARLQKPRLRPFRHNGAGGLMRLELARWSSCKRYRILAMRLRLKSRKISRAALWPGAPVTPPPGWPPEPHKYRPAIGPRRSA